MGDKITLNLALRTLHGKKARQLRSEGIVPAIVYGPGVEPISTQAEYNVIEKVWRHAGKHTPVHLTIDGKKKLAMIKDVDLDPVKRRLRHVSFHAVNIKDKIVAEVPIHLTVEGESPAERAGLVVLQSLERLEVKALPMDLPESLEISLASLVEAGDRLTVADITLPENVEFVEHKTGHEDADDEDEHNFTDQVIATVYEPSALQAANESAGGDAEDESEVESENGEAPEADAGDEKTEEPKKES